MWLQPSSIIPWEALNHGDCEASLEVGCLMGAHDCAGGGGAVRVAVVFRDVGKAVLSKGVRPVRLGADSVESFHVGWDSDTVGGIDDEMAVV